MTEKYFSLLADESRDCGEIEQISVCVRYVYEGELHDYFFNFIRAEGLDTNSIVVKPAHVLAVVGVCVRDHMAAQCNDGASTMSGRLHGLQALMRSKVYPMALYVHWWAHRLNLVVVACAKISTKRVIYASIEQLYTFFSNLAPLDFFEKTQKVLGTHEAQHRELKLLSKTRWCCQSEACSAVAHTLGGIIAATVHFAEDTNTDRSAAAQGIINFIDTHFVVCLQLFRKVLTLTSYSANYMQDKHLDIGIAVNHIDTLKMSLSAEDLFDEIWDTAKALLDEHAIPQPIVKRRRVCKEDAVNSRVWIKSDYKVRLFDPVVRLFIAELNRRCSKDTCSVLLAMSSLIPTSDDFLKIHATKFFIEHYHLNEELQSSEFTVFSNQYRKANPQLKTILEVINIIEPHKMVYTELYKAYQIACNILVTTAEND
ncbi:Zinc finger mym-type protein 1-like protein [Oopsacas minuta]|uniref:Zinc finger mym-type protein 1-like protein n=1 Tax=Oopsacas minuta TaxID=111878 RepID=A0AAV7K4S1_9METZ|nr:Zinc finger mym-type protein 1-like protein [Oopsacas minuta]KAI6656234.1 Zinc finger mym-type protein 1-like protein [Oopsacas minuta]